MKIMIKKRDYVSPDTSEILLGETECILNCSSDACIDNLENEIFYDNL